MSSVFTVVKMMQRRLGDWSRTKIMMLPNFNYYVLCLQCGEDDAEKAG